MSCRRLWQHHCRDHSAASDVRIVVRQRFVPPVRGYLTRLPLGEGVDAVDRTRRQALVAAAAQLGNDYYVGAVVEDGAELRRAVAQTRVAVDAFEHLDSQRSVLPLRAPR